MTGEGVPGPTGDYPQGQISPDDAGGLNIMVSEQLGMLRLDFGTALKWVVMPTQEAVNFANMIIANARAIAASTGEPVTLGRHCNCSRLIED